MSKELMTVEQRVNFPAASYNTKWTSVVDLFNSGSRNTKMSDIPSPSIFGVIAYTTEVIDNVYGEDVVDEKTGEVIAKKGDQTGETSIRLILLSDTGNAYRVSALSFIRRFSTLIQLFGKPENWIEPVYLKVTKENTGNKANWIYIVEVATREEHELFVKQKAEMEALSKKKRGVVNEENEG